MSTILESYQQIEQNTVQPKIFNTKIIRLIIQIVNDIAVTNRYLNFDNVAKY